MPQDTRMTYLTRIIRHGRIRSAESYRTGGRRKPAPIVHGTATGFAHRGCRCTPCVEAHRKYERDYTKRPKTWPTWAHGRRTTYKAGCRCDTCRTANARTCAAWRAKRRAVKAAACLAEKRKAERLAYMRDRYQAMKAGTWEVKR